MHKIGTIFKLNIQPMFSETEGEIVGIFTGDGSQYFEPKTYHYETNIYFGNKHKKYAMYVKKLYETFFKKKFRLEKSTELSIRLRTYSKELFHYFKNYLEYNPKVKHSTVRLKKLDIPLHFKRGFIKGLIDTDGYVKIDGDGVCKAVVYYTTSRILSEQFSKILSEFKITHGTFESKRPNRPKEKTVYVVNILKISYNKFIKEFKPLKAGSDRGRW